MTTAGRAGVGTTVERYAGYKGDEMPRAVIVDGIRLEVVEILLRQRVLEQAGGPMRDVWRCRLADGREVVVERLGAETWRVSAAARPTLPGKISTGGNLSPRRFVRHRGGRRRLQPVPTKARK